MQTPSPRDILAWWAVRPTVGAGALYALLATVLFGESLFTDRVLSSSDVLWSLAPWEGSAPEGVRSRGGSNPELADAAAAFQPFLQHTRAALPDLPLWNPHIGLGRPFLANAQSAILSPFSLPSYVLPFWWSLGLVAALKTWIAAFGAHLLGRSLGMRPGGALLAGLVFGFAPFLVVWVAWPLASVWAWLPWLLLGTGALVPRPRLLPAAGLATIVALQFLGGHPESSFHVLAIALAFLVLRMAVARDAIAGWRRLAAPPLAFLAAVVGGAALAGAVVVPFVELLLRSGDISARAGEPIHVDPKFAFTLLLNDYWGRPTATNLDGFAVQKAFYLGALPLMLAAVAVIARPTPERLSIAGLAAIALGVVLGVPPLFEVVTALPGFATVHNTRLTIVVAIGVALLAGWGLDDLAARSLPPARRRIAVGAIAGLAVLPLAVMAAGARLDGATLFDALEVAWGFAAPPRAVAVATPVVQQAALLVWLPLALAAVALVWLRGHRRIGPSAFTALAIALVALDLMRADMGQNPAISIAHAEQPTTETIRYLLERRPGRFVGLPPASGFVPLAPNLAMRYGLHDARSYDYPIERRYQELWRRWISPDPTFTPFTTVVRPTPEALRVLGLLGVVDLVQEPGDPHLDQPGARLMRVAAGARVYRNELALPRAFLVGAQQFVGGEREALEALGDPRTDLRRVVVVERPLAQLAEVSAGGEAPPPPGTARVMGYDAGELSVAVDARAPALLVVSDLHYPGWKAAVDGAEVEIERVDHLLRGVPVQAGAHEVTMHYEPLSWRLGVGLSLIALATLMALSYAGWRRR